MKRTHPGRPSVDDDGDSEQVCVTLPGKLYDEYSRRAILEDVSVPEIIRRELQERQSRRSE